MASSDPRRDYEQMLKILASMEYSRPVALSSISQKTGIKLAIVPEWKRNRLFAVFRTAEILSIF